MHTDLTGDIFGSLLVLRATEERTTKSEIIWETQCICGKHRNVKTSFLTSGKVTHCGCRTKVTKKLPGKEGQRKRLRKQKNKLLLSKLPDDKRAELIKFFTSGESIADIAERFNLSADSTKEFIRSQREAINTAWELHLINLVNENMITQQALDLSLRTKLVDPALAKLLSPEDSSALTEQEIVYGYIFVHSGSNSTALKESGLLEAIPMKQRKNAYSNILGIYLRQKQNVAQYISQLQQEYVSTTDLSKKYVQSEIVKQMEQVRELIATDDGNQRARVHMIKLIELAGKSVGAFVDKVEVKQVDHKSALDTLIEAAKEETISSTYTIEDSDS